MAGHQHDKQNGDRAGAARMEFLLTLRGRGIADKAVLRAIDEVRREHYVDDDFARDAYADRALPIACGQTISQPYVVAYMTEHLRVAPHHRVLEIGTGSGYQAAVLSRLAREVVSIERYRTLAEDARAKLAADGFDNVAVLTGDGFSGAPDKAPFDRIIVTAAAETVPEPLLDQLAEGGVMVIPVGPHADVQHIVRMTRSSETGLTREQLIPVRFVPMLPGLAREL